MIETNVKGFGLAWIVVKDLKEAIRFYTEVVGLTLKEETPEYGWAELTDPKGNRLGLAQESPNMDEKSGTNAILTLSVENLEKARSEFLERGAKLIGDVVEVPGHVRLQTFQDPDGNSMQLVETI